MPQHEIQERREASVAKHPVSQAADHPAHQAIVVQVLVPDDVLQAGKRDANSGDPLACQEGYRGGAEERVKDHAARIGT